MATFTHRLFHHDDLGFIAKRELQDDYAYDRDGYATWSEHDERLLTETAERLDTPRDQLRNRLGFFDVLFVPKEGFEESEDVLENLTDDPAVCPKGTWAAFPPIR